METLLRYKTQFTDNYTVNLNNYTFISHDENDSYSEGDKEEIYISLTEFLFTGVGVTIMTLFGVIGNIMSVIVLARPRMRSSVTLLLLGLTFCDTLLLVALFLLYGIKAFFDYLLGLSAAEATFEFITKYFSVITDCAQSGSVYFTVAMTLDRYIAVCWPLKSRYLCTWKRAKYVAGVIVIISIVFHMYGLNIIPEESNVEEMEQLNKLKTMCNFSTESHQSHQVSVLLDIAYENHYLRWPYLIFMIFIPFSTLVILNSFICVEIRKANKQRQNMTQKQASEISFAVVCVIIVAIFCLCNSAFFVMAVIERYYKCLWHQWKTILLSIDTFLVSVSAATNFLIYCALGGNFRRQAKQMLINTACCCCNCVCTTTTSSNSNLDTGA